MDDPQQTVTSVLYSHAGNRDARAAQERDPADRNEVSGTQPHTPGYPTPHVLSLKRRMPGYDSAIIAADKTRIPPEAEWLFFSCRCESNCIPIPCPAVQN